MSCDACSFPYSLCQCPATTTVGEIARLRCIEAEVMRGDAHERRLQKAVAEGGDPRTILYAGAVAFRRIRDICRAGKAAEDCDLEPDSTGFCEHHRPKAAP